MTITNVLASIMITTATAVASQDAPVAESANHNASECKEACDSKKCDLFEPSRFKFVESFEYVDFDGGQDSILTLNQTVLWTYDDFTSVHIDLPVFANGDAGLGMVEIGFDHKFIRNPCDFVDSVSLGFGFQLPTGEDQFGGDDANVVFGFDFEGNTPNESLNWNAGFEWIVTQDAAYVPVLGGLVFDNVVNWYAGFDYVISDDMSFGFGYDYWDADGGNSLSSIGPSLKWNIANNLDFSCGIDFVIDQGSCNNTDTVTQFGLCIKF